jgi:hypothetical protein
MRCSSFQVPLSGGRTGARTGSAKSRPWCVNGTTSQRTDTPASVAAIGKRQKFIASAR